MKRALLLLIVLFNMNVLAQKSEIPDHPSKLPYKSLDWKIPLGKPYRMQLKNGLNLYIAEDHNLPVISMSGYFKAGTVNDPKGKEGLGAFAVHLMKTGGTDQVPSDSLDALLEHFAISVSFSLKETNLKFSAKFLSKFADTAFYIIEQILFHPAFEQEKIDKERDVFIQKIKHRFDNPGPILQTAFRKNMYPDMANSRISSEKSMKSIGRDDLLSFHKRVFRTENVILSSAGDFDKKEFCKRLEAIFPKAANNQKSVEFPEISVKPAKKFLVIHKEISQAYVRIGLPFIKRPSPDYYPFSVANLVLGGGGFVSRLVTKVRSDAGLTYSIYSHAETNYIFPATFYISFFTKHATVNKAIALTLQEVARLVSDGITKDELKNAKKKLINSLPSMFRSKEDIVDTYAWNEYYGRSEDHYKIYPEKIKALKRREIKKIARKYIDTDAFTYVIVGDTAVIFDAEETEGFALKKQDNIKIISPEELYDPDLFN